MKSWQGKLPALAALVALARSAFAQGCVMCYTSAASQRPRAIHALNLGIIILLIPPVLIFLGVFAFFYLRRNAWRGANDASGALDPSAGAAGDPHLPFSFGRPAR
jgi:ABC-type sulfate transport system permease subunit